MTTVHANSPRDAISRLETMVLMAGFELPMRAIRDQVAAAIDIIMHVDRMPDGRRVVTSVTELQGLEGDVILLQEVFAYRHVRSLEEKSAGELTATGLRPKCLDRLSTAGVEVPARIFQPKAPPVSLVRPPRNGRIPSARELMSPERAR